MTKNLRELREKQDEQKQDTVWLARYLNAIDDVEEMIRNKIRELETKSINRGAKNSIKYFKRNFSSSSAIFC